MVIIKGTEEELINFTEKYFNCLRPRRENICSYYYNHYGKEGCYKCKTKSKKTLK